MFEDSLLESVGRIRTRSRRYVAGSFLLEAALVAALIIIPYVYPAALPQQFLRVPLISAPAAVIPQAAEHPAASSVRHPELIGIMLTAPSHIPTQITRVVDAAPPGGITDMGAGSGAGNGPPGVLFPSVTPAPTPPVRPAKPSGPIHVSSGVAQGQLLVPIRPVYPAIALASRTQGTVVVAATISKDGRIENLHVVSGPAMLVNAAVQAISQARYRPYLLNNEPVEVETTINVVFRLGGDS
jgi:protein TonB